MNEQTFIIEKITRTCGACPSQWQGTLIDGRMIYIRYRYGKLSFGISPNPTEDVYDAVGAPYLFRKQICEDTLDGFISLDEVKDQLAENGIILKEEI